MPLYSYDMVQRERRQNEIDRANYEDRLDFERNHLQREIQGLKQQIQGLHEQIAKLRPHVDARVMKEICGD